MDDKQKKLERYREENQSVTKGETLFVGSSLMEMFPVTKLLKEAGYIGEVYNRGIGGYTAVELLEAIDVCILELKPSRIFINIGTNDLTDPAISIEMLKKRYDEILTRIEIELPNVEIYLMAYYPVNKEAATEAAREALEIRTNEKIRKANQMVMGLAKKNKRKYIDVNDALKDEKGRLKREFTIEGIHINEDGYRAITPALLKYLE